MSDIIVLSAVRSFLADKNIGAGLYLTLPPHAEFPLLLIELEELWSHHPVKGPSILSRVRLKLGLYSHLHGVNEVMLLSKKVRSLLEGAVIPLPESKFMVMKLLKCFGERLIRGKSDSALHILNYYYEALIREEREQANG